MQLMGFPSSFIKQNKGEYNLYNAFIYETTAGAILSSLKYLWIPAFFKVLGKINEQDQKGASLSTLTF